GGGSRRRKGGPAHQCLPRGYRGPGGRAAAFRYDGGTGSKASRRTSPQSICLEVFQNSSLWVSGHSSRSATTGSTREARCAGITQAASATTIRSDAVPAYTRGADALTPNKSDLSSAPNPIASATPAANPTKLNFSPRRKIMRVTSL